MTIDYQVFLMDDMKTNEAIVENEDGSYSIFINERLCENKRLKSFYHAMTHIEKNDFEKENVQIIEDDAHQEGRAR